MNYCKLRKWPRAIVVCAGLLICLLLVRPAVAGDGRVRPLSNPKVLDITVYFLPDEAGNKADPAEFEMWEPVFVEFAKELWDATEGQLGLGCVTFTNSQALKPEADVWVNRGNGGARSDPDGYQRSNYHMYLFQNHMCIGEEIPKCAVRDPFTGIITTYTRGQFGLVHECGHYLFGLHDEYLGCKRTGDDPCPTDDEGDVLYTRGDQYLCSSETRSDMSVTGTGIEPTERLVTIDLTSRTGAVNLAPNEWQNATLSFQTGGESGNVYTVWSNTASQMVLFARNWRGDGAGAGDLFFVTRHSRKSCIMDGGSSTAIRNLRSEYCTNGAATEEFMHRGVGVVPDANDPFNMLEYEYFANVQEAESHISCWQRIANSRVPGLVIPSGDPIEQMDATAPVPEFKTVTSEPGIVLAIDTSNSMSTLEGNNTRLELAQAGARNAVDQMKEAEPIAMLSFNDAVPGTIPLPMSEATDAQKVAARDKIDALVAGGNTTAMGDALAAATDVLINFNSQDPDPLSARAVILLSDGISNIGRDPLDVLDDVRRDGRVTVHTIALGNGADRATLRTIAEKTGGQFFAVNFASELPTVLPEIVSFARGEVPIEAVAKFLGEDDQSFDVVVDEFAQVVTFTIGYAPGAQIAVTITDPDQNELFVRQVAGGQPHEREACLRSLSGVVTCPTGDLAIQFVDRDSIESGGDIVSTSQQFFRIPDPTPGTWTIAVDVLSPPAAPVPIEPGDVPDPQDPNYQSEPNYQILVTTESPTLSVLASIPVDDYVEFPAPIPIRVNVVAGVPVTGVDVTAIVRHPRGAKTEDYHLFDDGLPEHGDLRASDGVYSNLFHGYETESDKGGDGIYMFDITVVNVGGQGRPVGAREAGPDEAASRVIPDFKVRTQASILVSGIPGSIVPGAAGVGHPIGPTNAVPVKQIDIDATPVMRFSLKASNEYVRLESLVVNSSSPGEDADERDIVVLALYADENNDGKPDNPFNPLARARFVDDDGPVSFERPVPAGSPLTGPLALAVLPVGVEKSFIVALGPPQAPFERVLLAEESPAPPPGGLGLRPPPLPLWEWWVAGLVFLLAVAHTFRRTAIARPVAIGACLALAVVVTGATGCGNGGGPVNGHNGNGQGGQVLVHAAPLGSFRMTIDPADIGMTGATTGEPITASGEGTTSVVDVTD